MTQEWKIFRGQSEPHDAIAQLPAPPPWREFSARDERRGRTFRAREHEIELVNAALYLRRPILVTGPPGAGKTSLAYAVATELKLGPVLRWSINSRSTLVDGLYRYDALARLRDLQGRSPELEDDLGRYVKLEPMGTAFLPSLRPRVLLLDEIDKADIDLPNDLLHLFEEGEYEIPELVRIADHTPIVSVLRADSQNAADRTEVEGGRIRCREFPFVVITSNGERELSPAFLRRCLRLDVPAPEEDHLRQVIEAHFGEVDQKRLDELIKEFLDRRDERGHLLATDQLLNAVFLLTSEVSPSGRDREAILNVLLRELERR